MSFSCGDWLTTEKDGLAINVDDYWQTSTYLINSVLWFSEYPIVESFPEDDIQKAPSTFMEMTPRSMANYPKTPKKMFFSMNKEQSLQFWQAKNGDVWLMIKGFARYRDIFN